MENAGATTRENGEQRGVVGGNNGNFAGVALARPCPQSALTRGERAKKSQPIRVGILVLVDPASIEKRALPIDSICFFQKLRNR